MGGEEATANRWLVAVALVGVLVLSGCVRVVERSSGSVMQALPAGVRPVVGETHDLAILAVDFDPPLGYEELIARRVKGEGITLLIAVENAGQSTEYRVRVAAELSTGDGEEVLLERQALIDSIAPGEVKIVRFRNEQFPYYASYSLRVRVLPVEGEVYLSNNQRVYELTVEARE